MRLINYGLGEVLDRLTILELKRSYVVDHQQSAEGFDRERGQLLPQALSRQIGGKVFEGLLELATVNARLWQGEDALRGYREAMDGRLDDAGQWGTELREVVRLAFRIQEWNDRRAALVRQINFAAGDDASQEKVGVRTEGDRAD